MIRYTLVGAPAEEPVSLAEAKAHCRVENDAEDALVTRFIVAARQACEKFTGRAFVTQTWQATLDRWPCSAEGDGWPFYSSPTGRIVKLAHGPIACVDLVTVDEVDIDEANYKLVGDELRVKPAVADSTDELGDGIAIQYQAGAPADETPEDVRQAILSLVAHFYENREAANAAGIYSQVTPFAQSLLIPHQALSV